jgi:hypothetical protein
MDGSVDVPEAAPTAARTGRAYLNMPDIVDGVGKGLTVVLRSGQLCVAKMQQTDWTAEGDDVDGNGEGNCNGWTHVGNWQ